MSLKKTMISAAMATALGTTGMAVSTSASADLITMNWDGLFTMLNAKGVITTNNSKPYYYDATWGKGKRTQITGTMTFDTETGTGSATIDPFFFFAYYNIIDFTSISMQSIGDGQGGEGSLLLVNMLWNWSDPFGIPTAAVFDATGLIAASDTNLQAGDIINQGNFGFATPASDSFFASKTGLSNFTIGGIPISTTSWDTTPLCNTSGPANSSNCLGVNPIGTLPLLAGAVDANGDPIGGNPMVDGPFAGSNANFDIQSMTISGVTTGTHPPAIPVPAAVWLFGSGLLGLVGVARRKKT